MGGSLPQTDRFYWVTGDSYNHRFLCTQSTKKEREGRKGTSVSCRLVPTTLYPSTLTQETKTSPIVPPKCKDAEMVTVAAAVKVVPSGQPFPMVLYHSTARELESWHPGLLPQLDQLNTLNTCSFEPNGLAHYLKAMKGQK